MASRNKWQRGFTGTANGGSALADERVETFAVAGPIEARIVTRCGDISIHSAEVDQIQVRLTSSGAGDDSLLAEATVEFDPDTKALDIRAGKPRHKNHRTGPTSSTAWGSWFQIGRSDVDVELLIPAGSSATIETVSGSSDLRGTFASVTHKAASGNLITSGEIASLASATASGDLFLDSITRQLSVTSASGDVRCASTASSNQFKTASGDVDLTAFHTGKLDVRSASGDVRLKVAPGLVVDVDARSVAGSLESEMPLDSAGSGLGGELLAVTIATVSGDVRILRV